MAILIIAIITTDTGGYNYYRKMRSIFHTPSGAFHKRKHFSRSAGTNFIKTAVGTIKHCADSCLMERKTRFELATFTLAR